MSLNEKAISRFQEYLARTGGERHPITGHMMAETSDYQKNLYLKCLCMMSQFGDMISQEQIFLLQRLLAGIGGSEPLEVYMRQGLEADEATFAELVESALDAPMKRQFFFDVMLVNQITPPTSEAMVFLGALAEGLSIQKDELIYTAKICKALLEQEHDFTDVTTPKSMEFLSFFAYFKSCEVGITYQEKRNTIRYFSEKTSYSIDPDIVDNDKLRIDNAIISLHDHRFFKGCAEITFVDCEFTPGPRFLFGLTSVKFVDCKKISFINCRFSEFSCDICSFERCNQREFIGCTFHNCMHTYNSGNSDWKAESQLFAQYDCPTPLKLDHCIFNNCGGKNQAPYYRSCIIGGGETCIVSNCTFMDCWHYSGDCIDPDDKYRTLFSKSTINDNNTINNSAKFN